MATATTTQLKSAQRRQTLLKRKRAGIIVLLIGFVIFTVQITCLSTSLAGLHDNGVHCLEWIVPLLIGGIILGVAAETYYNEFVRVFEGVITSLYIEVDGYGICEYVIELAGFTAAGEKNVNRLTVSRAEWRRLQVGQSYRV